MDELFSRLAVLWARIDAGPLGPHIERIRRGWRRATGRAGARWRRDADRVGDSWRRTTAPARPAVESASSAARKAADIARPGTPPILYRDGMITLDEQGVVVSGYYLPFGRHRIPYGSIRAVREHPLTGGREFRLHGYTWPRYWYHRDARRAERSVALELETDSLLWPVLTPVDIDQVKEIITERISQTPGTAPA